MADLKSTMKDFYKNEAIEDKPWFAKDVTVAIRPETQKMLQIYCGIAPEDLVAHVEAIRERAWAIAPYPSVGSLTWLNSYLLLHEAHDTILSKLKSGASILDCGCMVAPDLRQLAYEGAPTENMYGFDIQPEFFDLGYDFYGDRDRFKCRFLEADGRKDLQETALGDLLGSIDIIWCPKFLHLFDRPTSIKYAAKLIQLLKPRSGSMFVGSQNGLREPMEMELGERNFGTPTIWQGNADTIKEDWTEVARLTGTKWDIQSRLLDLRTIGLHVDDGSAYKKIVGINLQWTATLLEPAATSIHSEA